MSGKKQPDAPPPAFMLRRTIAFTLDVAAATAVATLFSLAILAPLIWVMQQLEAPNFLLAIGFALIDLAPYVAFVMLLVVPDARSGQSFGKLLTDLHITTHADAPPLNLPRAAGRRLLALILAFAIIPLFYGLFGQRTLLHDRTMQTRVTITGQTLSLRRWATQNLRRTTHDTSPASRKNDR